MADGHGDPTCPRSARGAQMAVDAALSNLARFAKTTLSQAERCTVSELLSRSGAEEGLQRLTTAIIYEWTRLVSEDYAQEALGEEELARLGGLGAAWADAHVEHLYGSTLVAALLLPGTLVLVQMGDGSCAVVYEDGAIEDPVPPDHLCVGNVTTSLSDPDAASEIRCVVVNVDERPFVACYVATDGVDKSLVGAEGMADFCARLTCDLPAYLAEDALEPSLAQAIDAVAQAGSQDDVSMALIAQPSALVGVRDELVRRHEEYQTVLRLQWAKGRLVSMQRKRDYLLEQPSVDGMVTDRERYLAEYDELELYVRELEDKLRGFAAASVPDDPVAEAREAGFSDVEEKADGVVAAVQEVEGAVTVAQPAVDEVPPASEAAEATLQLPASAVPTVVVPAAEEPSEEPVPTAYEDPWADDPADDEPLDETVFLFERHGSGKGAGGPKLPVKIAIALALAAVLALICALLAPRLFGRGERVESAPTQAVITARVPGDVGPWTL